MGFQQLARDMVVMAFDVIADISTVTFYYRSADPTYNTSTGAVTDSSTSYSVKMLVSRWHAREIDNVSILPTDMKGIIAYTKLPITPNVHCTVMLNDIELDVVGVFTDPMTAAWILQLRKP